MSLYGQVMNDTINPIKALHNSSSLIGFGLTPEGQEGNEIMNDLLLDQAWDNTYQHGDLLPQMGQSSLCAAALFQRAFILLRTFSALLCTTTQILHLMLYQNQ